MTAVPAMEIGGTHVAVAMVELDGPAIVPGTHRREPLDAEAEAVAILGVLVGCATRLDALPGATWGCAIPGPFDYAAGIGRFEGVAKFTSLNGIDVGRGLLAGLPPESRIVFLNDAEAFLIGEWAAGAAGGHDRVAGITLGTGIGSAFLAGGVIVDEGPDVPPHGEVHLLTIDGRPLEETVSRRGILAAHRRLRGSESRLSERAPDVHELALMARDGDEVARRSIHEPLLALGMALAPWLDRFGATAIVVGGSMAASWDLVEPALRSGLGSSVALLPASRPDEAALLGAAVYATGQVGSLPRRHTRAREG